ncbi:MAG: hypothetical protein ACLRSW_13335 [Christensenellaceae bacterium]
MMSRLSWVYLFCDLRFVKVLSGRSLKKFWKRENTNDDVKETRRKSKWIHYVIIFGKPFR